VPVKCQESDLKSSSPTLAYIESKLLQLSQKSCIKYSTMFLRHEHFVSLADGRSREEGWSV